MEWIQWSGFDGNGKYVIINKSSLLCLELREESGDDYISLKSHTSNNPAQLWWIAKWQGGDLYILLNERYKHIITSRGPNQTVLANLTPEEITSGNHPTSPLDGLWVIDKGMYALLPGRMVAFRSVKYPGFVLTDNIGVGVAVASLLKEELDGPGQERQQWLLQKVPERKREGFEGEGTYVIINKSSRLSLEMSDESLVLVNSPYTPHDPAQLWSIRRHPSGDGWGIVNLADNQMVLVQDEWEPVVGDYTVNDGEIEVVEINPDGWYVEALWIIDKAMDTLEPGQPVIFRNFQFDEFVLTAGVGERIVTIEQEPHTPSSGHGREGQLWLLQKQAEMTLTVGGPNTQQQ
ncbi:MAG: hypothetical protein Q9226_003065 [Calogaya cf. arnoldii]